MLWDDMDRERANASLRQMLARVRKLENKIGTGILLTDAHSITLNTAAFRVDIAEALSFDSKSLIARGDVQKLGEFVDKLSSDLFGGIAIAELGFETWLTDILSQLHHRAVGVLRYLVASKHFENDLPRLERYAHKLIEIDRYAEAGYRALMEIYDRHGDRPLALQTYQQCRKVLRLEMDVEPEAATRKLAASLGFVEFAGALRLGKNDQGGRSDASEPSGPTRQHRLGVPRIALLAPLVVVEDEETRRVATAFMEDVISGLSRFRSFMVLAPRTSFLLGQNRKADAEMPDIAFRYAVNCTIKPAFSGLRAGFRLMEGEDGSVLWSSEWDFRLDNLPFLYSQLCHQIIYSLADAIECAERRFPFAPKDATAYRLYLEGRAAMNGTSLQKLRAARNWFRQIDQPVRQFRAGSRAPVADAEHGASGSRPHR